MSQSLKTVVHVWAAETGFTRIATLTPFNPRLYHKCAAHSIAENYQQPAAALLVAALPYGNQGCADKLGDEAVPPNGAWIAPFARRNYYREAVKRLQALARRLREQYGGVKADFRILCNSPVPEKPLAVASGLGCRGRNGLIITAEAGSLCVLAAMTLPYALEPEPHPEQAAPCVRCDAARPPCVAACPTGALRGDGSLDTARCIQWYASGNGDRVPSIVAEKWGRRLYGCTLCQDACVHNHRPIQGIFSTEGPLPAYFDARELIAMRDADLSALFKGTALGLSWLGPAAIRRNALLALENTGNAYFQA
ncbi:MAG: iron-sulfur protein [Treponema sp.]|jgi:epoxyqueuosine reductase QueG|nr:iron-sulfur protein [Treponema sp.]